MAKEKIICDSDVIIDYWNINSSRHKATKHTLEIVIGIDNVLLSSITMMELLIGANNKKELGRINKSVHQFENLLINTNIAQTAIQLLQNYNLSHGLALPDSLIAATSILSYYKLFTYNLKDYKFIDSLNLFTELT